jgi:hypothetical protein
MLKGLTVIIMALLLALLAGAGYAARDTHTLKH